MISFVGFRFYWQLSPDSFQMCWYCLMMFWPAIPVTRRYEICAGTYWRKRRHGVPYWGNQPEIAQRRVLQYRTKLNFITGCGGVWLFAAPVRDDPDMRSPTIAGFWNKVPRGIFSVSPSWSIRPTTWCGTRSASSGVRRKKLLGRQEPLLTTVKRRNLARHFGGWVTPWSAKAMPDERHQRVDNPADARRAHKGLLYRGLEEWHQRVDNPADARRAHKGLL